MAVQWVLPFNLDNLKSTFVLFSDCDERLILLKSHLNYFFNYLDSLGVKTLIIDNDYINFDFIEDYSDYYSRCFQNYEKRCTRLHFFSHEFTQDQLFNVLNTGDITCDLVRTMQDQYCGFAVIKKLPDTFIGKTCLKTYDQSKNGYERNFLSIRSYVTNLWGIPLSVSSLAFQEQDSTVFACATSAIWSTLQGTGKLFNHYIPSPVEITKNAMRYFSYGSRDIPNEGLTDQEMVQGIKWVGLTPKLSNAENLENFQNIIFSYLSAKIPLILNFLVYKKFEEGRYLFDSAHSVSVTGYCLNLEHKFIGSTPLLKADRLNKVYVHDDQIGPFARMEISTEEVLLYEEGYQVDEPDEETEEKCSFYLTSSMGVSILNPSEEDKYIAIPDTFIVPLYKKIRITFENLLEEVYLVDRMVKVISDYYDSTEDQLECVPYPIEWEIKLQQNPQFKREVLQNPQLSNEERKSLTMMPLPRFIWTIRGWNGQEILITLMFDGTDFKQGKYFLGCVEAEEKILQLLRQFSDLQQMEIDKAFKGKEVDFDYHSPILKWFRAGMKLELSRHEFDSSMVK